MTRARPERAAALAALVILAASALSACSSGTKSTVADRQICLASRAVDKQKLSVLVKQGAPAFQKVVATNAETVKSSLDRGVHDGELEKAARAVLGSDVTIEQSLSQSAVDSGITVARVLEVWATLQQRCDALGYA